MPLRVVATATALAAIFALSCTVVSGLVGQATGGSTPSATRTLPTPVDTPAPRGSAQPQLVTAPDGSVLLSWLETTADGHARFRGARFDGRSWASWTTIAEGRDFFVNWADVPSVIQLRDGRLAAHWLQKNGPDTFAYSVRLRVSDDGGRTWSETITPHRDATETEHGFVSMFDAPGGGLGLVWLDGREMKAGHDTHAADSGAMTLRYTSLGRDRQLGPEMVLDDRVCECCPTTAVATPRGIVAAYRNRGHTEVRDIFVSRLEGRRWTSGVAVHEDRWTISACPVNGPSLAARGDAVSLAWFTAEGDDPRVMAAFSRDAGTTWGTPVRVDDGVAIGRIDSAMLPDGSALVSWIEFGDGKSEFRARKVRPDGSRDPSFPVAAVSSARSSGYPRLTLSGPRVYFAWTETVPERRVRMAVMALP